MSGTGCDIRLGTSSWTGKGWAGTVYPRGLPQGEWLGHYASRFSTVEADVTYYRVPSADMVRRWRDITPDDFVLSAKFPRSVVHRGDGPAPDAATILRPEAVGGEAEAFVEAMGLLGDKCGPLVLQFPYFNKKAFTGPEPFLERLDDFLRWLPDTHRYAVEVRNRGWIGPPLIQLLRQHRVGLVLVDLKYMPHPEDLARELDLITADFVYFRLIGDRKAIDERTDTFDEIVIDRTDRLRRWASLIDAYAARVPSIVGYANNHFAGHAPATIEQLASMLSS
jgi:uncharacterized protein YecE (DUF72 family)